MRRVGECEDGRSIGAVGRKRLERGFLKVRVGAEQRAQLRPSRRVPGIRGDIRGGSPDPVRRKAGERRELAEAGFDIARAQILVGEEIARGERARVAMLRRLESASCQRRVARQLRLHAADQEWLDRQWRLRRGVIHGFENAGANLPARTRRGADLRHGKRQLRLRMAGPCAGRGGRIGRDQSIDGGIAHDLHCQEQGQHDRYEPANHGHAFRPRPAVSCRPPWGSSGFRSAHDRLSRNRSHSRNRNRRSRSHSRFRRRTWSAWLRARECP